jgi:hypothetical protein
MRREVYLSGIIQTITLLDLSTETLDVVLVEVPVTLRRPRLLGVFLALVCSPNLEKTWVIPHQSFRTPPSGCEWYRIFLSTTC